MTETASPAIIQRLAELERRFAERTAELEAERARLGVIVENMLGGVVICDAGSGRIAFANEQAKRLLGPDAAQGESFEQWERYDGYREDGIRYDSETWPLSRAVRDGESVRGELIRIERPGGSVWLESSAAPVRDSSGAVVAGVLIVNDVTERHERHRAEREFVTNAAHELRTPITAIAGAVEVLQAGAKDDPADRDRFLGHIERASHRLGRLGRALLALARAQTAQESPRMQLVELRPLLEEVVRELEPATEVEIVIDCEPELATVTNADLLEQALSNLARNAVAYTQRGRVRLCAEADAENVVVTVTDTGSGLPEDATIEHLFERFYRHEGPAESAGFGLGLAIAAESIRALGGQLDLQPLNGGTRASITLPLARLVVS